MHHFSTTVGKALKTGEDAKLPKEKVAKAAGEAESVVVVGFDTWERVMESVGYVGLVDELDGVIGSMGRRVSLHWSRKNQPNVGQ